MAQVINTNVASLTAQRNMNVSQRNMNTAMQRLSSGLRVNSAKDDAAGLSIATKMDSQVRGMNAAIRNANDGVSYAQTADGALATAVEALQRMRELAVQGMNGTNASEDWTNLDKEFQQLAKEVTRLSTDTTFNGTAILSSSSADVTIQVGADKDQTIAISKTDLNTISKTIDGTGKVSDATESGKALDLIDKALEDVNSLRSDLGASQNRLTSAISNLEISVENQSAAKSRIMDADFATETANMTRGQILQQAGTAMLAQAKALPQNVLSLLQ